MPLEHRKQQPDGITAQICGRDFIGEDIEPADRHVELERFQVLFAEVEFAMIQPRYELMNNVCVILWHQNPLFSAFIPTRLRCSPKPWCIVEQ